MHYQRFEEVPVWQSAVAMTVVVFAVTKNRAFRFKGDIDKQIQRASLSIASNIAEGFERHTSRELVSFLYIARGSAGEVRSILSVMERMPDFDPIRTDILSLKSQAESISRQIRGWIDALQARPIQGPPLATHPRQEAKAAAPLQSVI